MSWIQLDDYQLNAIEKMKNGCILCGDVGSGKSRTALAYYYQHEGGKINADHYIYMPDPPRDLFIITTAQKRDKLEWEGELGPFLLSTKPKTNYYHNTVIVDSWNNITKYADIQGAFFIFDEQRVIGSGVWVKAFLKIAKQNHWILLSATPGDCWEDYIPVFIANGFYKNRTEFIREHIVYSRFSKFPKVDRYICTGKLLRYRKEILVNMEFKRHTVPHHEIITCTYDQDLYKDIRKRRWNPWTERPIQNSGEFCFCLRKAVNTHESRQIALLEILEDHPRAIIFYNFDYELKILQDLYYGEDVKIAEWNGHVHQPIPDSEKWVYLVQYAAGSEGWNCTTTDTIIFFSQNYSYRTNKQASGRIDRRNTPFIDLYYYHLRSMAQIDLDIARAVKQKKNFNTRGYMEQ